MGKETGGKDNSYKIKIKKAIFGYGNKPVVKIENLEINKGITCIVGPNGAGKTTFLRGISGVLQPIQGNVLIGGIDLFGKRADEVRRKIGFLPENSFPYPDMTVIEYLEYWANLYGKPENIEKVLHMMKIEDIVNKIGYSLSNGQKRRVMIARIFLIEPAILILDEPTANLDPNISFDVMNFLLQLGERMPIVYSTHHLMEIEKFFDRILFIKEGKLIGAYTKEEISDSLYEVYKKLMG